MADTKTAPCWVLTNADGEDLDQDGVPHFPTEEKAAEHARRTDPWAGWETPAGFKPRQLDHVCVILACSCCEYVYDEDEDGICHFDSPDEAEKALAGFWEFTGGVAKCDACKVGPCDPERGDHG